MASRRERRERRLRGDWGTQTHTEPVPLEQRAAKPHAHDSRNIFHRIYDHHFKVLLFASLALVVLAMVQVGVQYATTGEFLHKGVSLKGGLTITIPTHGEQFTPDQLQTKLNGEIPNKDIIVRGVSEFGELKGVTIEAAEDSTDPETVKALEERIVASAAELIPAAPQEFSVEVVGPALGDAFFTQTLKAVVIAFLLMGVVLFYYFSEGRMLKALVTLLSVIASYVVFNATGTLMAVMAVVIAGVLIALFMRYSPPSMMVILCAFSDIVVTLAIVNLLGIKVSTAGVAAFLMLIGYSVDTDILLSVRVLKHKNGTVYERTLASMKTGMTMSISSMAAAIIGYFVSQSSTIREIMLIIAIGLALDIIFTWIQNVGLLRWYIEKRMRHMDGMS